MLRTMVRCSAWLLAAVIALSGAAAAPERPELPGAPAAAPGQIEPDTAEIAAHQATSCAAWSAARIDCFVLGNDRMVWHIFWNGADWGNWDNLGAPGPISDTLGRIWVTARGVNSLDVFVAGVPGSPTGMFLRRWDGATWLPWQNQAAPQAWDIADIACLTLGASNLECFVRSTDNRLRQRSWNGGSWGAWIDLGAFPSASGMGGIAAATYGAGDMVVYAIGGDGNAYRRYYEFGAWSAWLNDGFPVGFPLRQVACHTQSQNAIDCAYTDNGGGVWIRRWTLSGQWANFEDLDTPPSLASGLAISHYNTTGTQVFANAANGRFYRRFRDTDSAEWSDWIDQGRPPDQRAYFPLLRRYKQ